jgi:RNA-directed DNA polymerase
MLVQLRADLKARRFRPAPVRERMIPKANDKLRRLGIPTAVDRVVQAALKLVLEPIFEADFRPSSYGFRPRRRAQDAIAEIFYLGSATRNYLWVFEADIQACFDEIDHTALLDRVRRRVGDKRVLALLKALLRAGILSEDAVRRDTTTGTPQGGIIRPCSPISPFPRWTSTSHASGRGSVRSGPEPCRHPAHAARSLRGRLRGDGRRQARRRRRAPR